MEEKDYLKEFISENREQFDVNLPSKDLWGRIEDELDSGQKLKSKVIPLTWWGIAASVLLLVSAGFYMGRVGVLDNAAYAEDRLHHLEMDHHYAKQVNMLVAEARNSSDVDASVFQDIKTIEEQYDVLVDEYQKEGLDDKKEILLSAMISNYQTRIDMLSHVLFIIKKSKYGNDIHTQKIEI